jgi:hypothetical protein
MAPVAADLTLGISAVVLRILGIFTITVVEEQ